MRLLLLGAATIALSGCSWFGHGGSNYYGSQTSYGHYSGGEPCCDSGQPLSRWNLEAAAGAEFIVGGTGLTGDDVPVVPGVAATDQSMSDLFDTGMRYELGGSYAMSPNRKVTLMGSYAKADGKAADIGTIGGAAVTGNLTDYERYGIEAGLRQYFMPSRAPIVKSVRPYVEARVGAARVSAISLENAIQAGAAVNGGTVPLYEETWVPTGAGLVGIEAPIFKRATLALESGIRYSGAPNSDESFLGVGHSLNEINNGGSSWTVPVMLRGRYRF